MSGTARTIERHKRVFINCPFDREYLPTFDALVFTVVCCGFEPASAIESDDVARSRVRRIFDGLRGAKYSLHDLSRCHGEGPEQFARFNMPLELGMAMALNMGVADEGHDWAVLVREGHGHLRFVSDLAGYDLLAHDGSRNSVVPRVMRWLTTREDAPRLDVTPAHVLAALPRFDQRKSEEVRQWRDELPWGRLLQIAVETAPHKALSL